MKIIIKSLLSSSSIKHNSHPTKRSPSKKLEQRNNDEQISLAKMIDEKREWESTLANTQDKLSLFAKEAIEEYRSGKRKQETGSKTSNH